MHSCNAERSPNISSVICSSDFDYRVGIRHLQFKFDWIGPTKWKWRKQGLFQSMHPSAGPLLEPYFGNHCRTFHHSISPIHCFIHTHCVSDICFYYTYEIMFICIYWNIFFIQNFVWSTVVIRFTSCGRNYGIFNVDNAPTGTSCEFEQYFFVLYKTKYEWMDLIN